MDYEYGQYESVNRYSADQVPYQDTIVKRTVDIKGKGSIHIKKSKGEFDRRFCTLQVCIRAAGGQNMKLYIIFKGKPTPGDPTIPVSGILKKEIPNYDSRVVVLWDPVAYLNHEQAQTWYFDFEETC